MENRRLDGNAAGGMLGEIFPFDMTLVRGLCAHCGAFGEMAEQVLYVDAPGLVLRCNQCSGVLVRVVRGGGRMWLDLRGVVCLQIEETA
jgi:hypothetical protein